MFHQKVFAPLLEESMDLLKHVPISFHGPYYKAEHSAPQGTPEYEYTMELVGQTLRYSEKMCIRDRSYMQEFIKINSEDTVAVALKPLSKGSTVAADPYTCLLYTSRCV